MAHERSAARARPLHILAAIGPETVRVPTLFIRGGQSNYILREDLPTSSEQFPNGRVETIPYAGHLGACLGTGRSGPRSALP